MASKKVKITKNTFKFVSTGGKRSGKRTTTAKRTSKRK